jgi:hypothetical protein
MSRYPNKDRADVVARALLSTLARHLREPGLHAEIAAVLREEFSDIQQMTLNEIREGG